VAIDRIVALALNGIPDVEIGRVRTSLVHLMNGADQAAADRTRETVRTRTAPILAGDGPLDVRARAALLAADAGVPDAERTLLVVVAESKNVVLRSAVLQWLGKNGSAAAVPVVEAASRDATVRPAAALTLQALAKRDVPEAKDALARLPAARPTAAPVR
jgi:hypothetical protein